MAYKKRTYRKRKFNLRRVRMSASGIIGALAALDVVKAAVTAVAADTYRIVSVDCAYSITDLGALADDGFAFGLAHSGYTAAQIEECLESQTSIDLGDKIAQERANRLVREVGMISGSQGAVVGGGLPFNNGRRVKTRLNWKISIGDTLDIWVRNSSGVIYTTGASITMNGDLWLKDAV